MKLLLNDKEIAHFLNDNMSLIDKLDHIKFKHTCLSEFKTEHRDKMSSKKVNGMAAKYYFNEEQKKKFAEKLKKSIIRDLNDYIVEVKEFLQRKREYNFQKIHKNIDVIIDTLGKEYIIELYKNSNYQNFVKGTGFSLDKNAVMMRRKEFGNYQEDCLIRNTVGNEELLVTKIDKKYPMWFIDSGYTNFLEPNKKWHRLVRNHLHYGEFFDAPMSRLENFPKFPVPWRRDGDTIYVIEPGPFCRKHFSLRFKNLEI
mgnify:CR=1 FL=1